MSDREYKRFAGQSVNNAGYHNHNWDLFHNGNELRDVSFPSLAAAIKAIGSASKTLYITTQHRITSKTVTPSNISIIVLKGGSFAISTGVTLTINGSFEAGNFQVFTGAGTVVGLSLCNPWWWGAKDDGTTGTTGFQAAVVCAEASGGAVFAPPTDNHYYCGRVNIATGGIKIFGDHTKIKQVYDAVAGSGGAGTTKVSPVFFCKKTSSHIEITGFHFTTDDSTYPSITVPEWASYMAPICINRSDYVNIHHNTFAGNKDRAIFLYGGNYCHVKNNYFLNTSMVMHIGITDNENFWDSTTSYATVYGPTAPVISDNYFIGYTWNNNCLFLSGPNDFTITGNKFIGFNNTSATVVRLYVNDLGMFNGSGTALTAQSGVFADNTIRGTFLRALSIAGQAGGATESLLTFMIRYKIDKNTIEGTGVGIDIERAYELRITDNDVKTSNAPLYIKRELVDSIINHNHLECTSVSDIVPAIDSTIVIDTNAVIWRLEMNGNEIVCPAADLYLLFSSPGVVFRDFTFRGNTLKYNSTVATNRAVQFNHTGLLDFSENLFYINSSTLSDRHIVAINKTIGPWNDLQGYNPGYTVIPTVANGYQYRSTSPVGDSGATEPTWPTTLGGTVVDGDITWICEELRARAVVNKNRVVYASVRNRGIDALSNSVYCSDNMDFQMISLAGTDVFASGNRVEAWASSTTVCFIVENTTHAHVSGNYISRPFSLNTPVLSMDTVVNSKVIGNYISGNSNAPLGRATVSGRLEHFGNTIVNAGAGGTGFSVTSAALARSMTQESKGANVTAANDLTLGMDGTYFKVDGSTQTNGIAIAGWQAGQIITLEFVNAPTLKHNTAASAGFASFQLAGAADFVATAGDTLTVRYDGTYWREMSRAVI